jgi:hypothetical protein
MAYPMTRNPTTFQLLLFEAVLAWAGVWLMTGGGR